MVAKGDELVPEKILAPDHRADSRSKIAAGAVSDTPIRNTCLSLD